MVNHGFSWQYFFLSGMSNDIVPYNWWHLRFDDIGNTIPDHLSYSEIDVVNQLAEPVGSSVQLTRLCLCSPASLW